MTSTSQSFQGELVLYTYFRSSCSCRVRTAAALKGIPLSYRYINLLKSEQASTSYAKDINPNAVVPTLQILDSNGRVVTTITQSIAILEFFEEGIPSERKLLPSDPIQRARVRELVNLVACDMQPPTNLRVLKRVNGLGVTNSEWFRGVLQRPLEAYERILEGSEPGLYSVGDLVTLADVCLAPAIENAVRWEVDLDKFPRVMRVYKAVSELEEFKKAGWREQEDTPAELRGK